jgi:hypothetical protein
MPSIRPSSSLSGIILEPVSYEYIQAIFVGVTNIFGRSKSTTPTLYFYSESISILSFLFLFSSCLLYNSNPPRCRLLPGILSVSFFPSFFSSQNHVGYQSVSHLSISKYTFTVSFLTLVECA